MSDLRAVIRIKNMAQAAASGSDQPGPEEGLEMAAAYERLRAEARALNRRAGWGEGEEFDKDLPPINTSMGNSGPVYTWLAGDPDQQVTIGRRARVLLGQLAAWAAGNQEAFEIEERLKADAATRAARRTKDPPGFR
jgi:hypothetical protein